MPRRADTSPEPGTAVGFALPDDIREALLKSQAQQIESTLQLPRVTVMAAGVGMYEFSDDTEGRTESFTGVVLGSHPRNVLWDRKMNSMGQVSDGEKMPACSSGDGLTATPREGFPHGQIGRPANGTEVLTCKTCLYNKFGSGALLIGDKNPKGKACTNQRSVYVMLPHKMLPIELVLSPTGITPYDEYLARMLNRGRPVQSIWTVFTQKIQTKGTLRWGVPVLEPGEPLAEEEFHRAIAMMQRFEGAINPASRTAAPVAPTPAGAEPEPDAEGMDFEVMP